MQEACANAMDNSAGPCAIDATPFFSTATKSVWGPVTVTNISHIAPAEQTPACSPALHMDDSNANDLFP